MRSVFKGSFPALCGFLLLVSGCAHADKSAAAPAIDGGAVARSVVLCRTNEAELRERLGKPTRDGLLHGQRIMSWIVGEDATVHYLAVLLDDHGVVTDLYWDVPTEIPWTPASQCSK